LIIGDAGKTGFGKMGERGILRKYRFWKTMLGFTSLDEDFGDVGESVAKQFSNQKEKLTFELLIHWRRALKKKNGGEIGEKMERVKCRGIEFVD
jgi:hypothetical protein